MFVAQDPHQLERRPRAVALGTFDGVHRGHRELLRRVAGSGLRATVVTLYPHPRLVVGGGVQLLSSLQRRLELLEQAGAQDVLVVDFTAEVAAMAPAAWAGAVLTPIGTCRVVVGENFRFGRKREGDVPLLRSLGFEVDAVPLVPDTSSTLVRDAVAAGDLELAARILGRPFELEGRMSPRFFEERRGRDTMRGASLLLDVDPGSVLPPPGAYAGETPAGPVRVTVRGRRVVVSVPRDATSLRGREVRVVVTGDAPPVRAALRPAAEPFVAAQAVS
jgi:riboflavin kinase/FMN adenylyltransferase